MTLSRRASGEPFFREAASLPAGGLHVVFCGGKRPPLLKTTNLKLLESALGRWSEMPGLRWVAFTSSYAGTFLAGADFEELGGLGAWDALDFSSAGQGLFRAMRTSKLWFVACPEGASLGGGLDFLLACDYRIAGPRAVLGHPGPKLGFFTGWGGTAHLPRRGAAGLSALLGGRILRASEALQAGWLEEVADDPLSEAASGAMLSSTVDLAGIKALRRTDGLPLWSALHVERLLSRER